MHKYFDKNNNKKFSQFIANKTNLWKLKEIKNNTIILIKDRMKIFVFKKEERREERLT